MVTVVSHKSHSVRRSLLYVAERFIGWLVSAEQPMATTTDFSHYVTTADVFTTPPRATSTPRSPPKKRRRPHYVSLGVGLCRCAYLRMDNALTGILEVGSATVGSDTILEHIEMLVDVLTEMTEAIPVGHTDPAVLRIRNATDEAMARLSELQDASVKGYALADSVPNPFRPVAEAMYE